MEGYMTGVENSHIAIKNGMTYETPEFASYSTDIKIAPQVATGALYGDNAARATQAKTTKYIVTATFTNLPLALKAKILGHQYSNGQMITKSTDKAPKMAYGFNFTKENGAKRYVWLYNGQWQENEENGQSESENINFQTVTLTGEFIVREDNTFKMTLDTDSPGYNPQKAANWYKAVQEFEEDTTEPTLVSSVPADAATGVAIDSTITLTFNKAMNLNTLNNILVVDELVNDVDTTITLSDDYKTVTITPKANLGANMLHNVILNKLMDTAGNTLPYTTIDFTNSLMNAIGVTQVKIKLADTTYILTYDMQALFYIDNKYESFQAFLEDIKVGNLVAVKVALEGGTLRGKQEFNPCLIHLKDVFIITSKIIYAISSNMPDNDKTHKATKSRDKSKTDLSKLLEQYYYIGLAELKLCRNDLLSMTLKELFRMIDINRNGIKTKKTVPLEAVI